MKDINLKGVVPAAILPMSANYEPDYPAFARYLEWIIAENAVAIAVNMDTGEGPQLKAAERRKAVETAVRVANGRVAVVAGVMGGSTMDAVETARLTRKPAPTGWSFFQMPPSATIRSIPRWLTATTKRLPTPPGCRLFYSSWPRSLAE